MHSDTRKRQIIEKAFNFLHFWLEKENLDMDDAYNLWRQKQRNEQEKQES